MKIVFVHLSDKPGGGSSQLNYWRNYYESLGHICIDCVLRKEWFHLQTLIYSRDKKCFIFSDPLVGFFLQINPMGHNVFRYSQGDDFNLYGRIFPGFFGKILNYIVLSTYRNSHFTVIANSNFTEEVIRSKGFSSLHKVWPQILVPKHSKPMICSIQSPNNRKNFELFLRLFERFKEDFDFVVISNRRFSVPDGMGFFEPQTRENLFTMLRASFAHVSTSFYDSFGLPIYEAMFVEIPSIIFENESFSINEDTSDLLFIRNNDINVFGEYLKKLEDVEFKRALIIRQKEIVSVYLTEQPCLNFIFNEDC